MFAKELRKVRCTCGRTCGLFFKANRWWCGNCLWAEVERLRENDLLAELSERHIPWSQQTFGDGQRLGGITKHIESELAEIRANPTDVEEWIDVVILALDGAWRSGHSAKEVVRALFAKLATIRERVYPKPVSEDVASMHCQTTEAKGGE